MKCPKCNTEIEFLYHFVTGYQRETYSPTPDEIYEYSDPEFISDGDIIEFECPDCGETLTTKEDEARKLFEVKKCNTKQKKSDKKGNAKAVEEQY